MRLEVRAIAAALSDDASIGVGEVTDRLGASGIDAEDMHASAYVTFSCPYA
jgi:hypothetical protein